MLSVIYHLSSWALLPSYMLKFFSNVDFFSLYWFACLFFSVVFRYEDFFGAKKEKSSKRKAQLLQESDESGDEGDNNKQVSYYFFMCVGVNHSEKRFIL